MTNRIDLLDEEVGEKIKDIFKGKKFEIDKIHETDHMKLHNINNSVYLDSNLNVIIVSSSLKEDVNRKVFTCLEGFIRNHLFLMDVCSDQIQ
jgi:hypothetical protein